VATDIHCTIAFALASARALTLFADEAAEQSRESAKNLAQQQQQAPRVNGFYKCRFALKPQFH